MVTVLEKNLEALARRFPETFKRVAGASELPSDSLVIGPKGAVSAWLTDPSGKAVLLNSKYDPTREATRLVQALPRGPTDTYIVIGYGLGYHVAELLKTISSEANVFVFEKSKSILKAGLSVLDLSADVADGRLGIFVAESEADVYRALEPQWTMIFGGQAHFVRHPPSFQIDREGYEEIAAWISNSIAGGSVIFQTSLLVTTQQYENLVFNLDAFTKAATLKSFEGSCRGMPGILVCAGPSLSKNIAKVCEAQDHAIVGVVSTARLPAVAAGIEPDFTNVCDFHGVSRRYFESSEDTEVPLFCDPLASHEAVRAYRGPKVFHEDEMMLKIAGIPDGAYGIIEPGSSVAHHALKLLLYFGCDPIILVGLDLSYTAHVTHVPGSAFFQEWRGEVNEFTSFEKLEIERLIRLKRNLALIEDVQGRTIYTTPDFASYVPELGAIVTGSKTRVYDCTEGGAKIPGTIIESFDVAAKRALTKKIDKTRFREIAQAGRASAVDAKKRLSELNDLVGGARDRLEILAKDYEKIGESPSEEAKFELEKRKQAVIGNASIERFIRDLGRSDELARLRADRELRAMTLTNEERARKEVRRDFDHTKAMLSSTTLFLELIERALVDLNGSG
ncbi:MAG: DUF115 domain-containing protein [Planctomycetes bacterium]|nr:DUF115 domain-containing protein [Planctomycetota bacterium]